MKDGDEQFYAYRDFNTGDAQITSADSGTTTDGGQLLANSGAVANLDGSDVTTGTPLNVLNPYMSLNFIIYAGEVT